MSVELHCAVCTKLFALPPSTLARRNSATPPVCSRACRTELAASRRAPCSFGCPNAAKTRGLCKTCAERERRKRPEVKQQRLAAAKEYSDRPEVRERQRAHARAYMRKRMGFSTELVDALSKLQAGRCAICLVQMSHGGGPTTESADHCHNSNAPRGLLCRICNTALGMYEAHQRPAGIRLIPYDIYLASPPASKLSV